MALPIRTPLLLLALVCLTAGVLLLGRAIDQMEERANASYEVDRFGNPWYPNYQQTNVRISRMERLRAWLVWAGVLPVDVAVIVASLLDLVRRQSRRLAGLALLTGLTVAVLLALTALAAVVPAGSIGG